MQLPDHNKVPVRLKRPLITTDTAWVDTPLEWRQLIAPKVRIATPCWMWEGASTKEGYGLITYEDPFALPGTRSRVNAHIFVAKLFYTIAYKRFWVKHSCGRNGCVNPAHLVVHQNNRRLTRKEKL